MCLSVYMHITVCIFCAMCQESHYQEHNSTVLSQYLSYRVCKLFSSSGMISSFNLEHFLNKVIDWSNKEIAKLSIMSWSRRSNHIKVVSAVCFSQAEKKKHRESDSEKLRMWAQMADRILLYLWGQKADKPRLVFGCKLGLIHALTGTTLANTILVGCSHRNLTRGSFLKFPRKHR